MGDYKRGSPTIADMDTSSGASMSKRRKSSVTSCELQLCSSGSQLPNTHLRDDLHDKTVSPASSVNSAGTVVSGEFPDRLLSCFSSNIKTSPGVTDSSTTTTPSLDLEAKGFETVESTYSDFKLFRDRYLLSEFSGDSEETMILPAKSLAAAVSKQRNIPAVKMPPKEEIEEFFAMAEKYEQKRFSEKYNYDIVKDMPLEGRYQWVRLN